MTTTKDKLEPPVNTGEPRNIAPGSGNHLVQEVAELYRKLRERGGTSPQLSNVSLSETEASALRSIRSRIAKKMEQGKTEWRKVITGNENMRVRDHATRKVRKAVTGSSDKLLREWVKEAKVVKTVDKFSFMLGVFLLCTTEYVLLQHPQHFVNFYVVTVTTMCALRLWMYSKNRWTYFMLDFCYFANAAVYVNAILFPESRLFWRINYVISNGVLLFAMFVWRNSLVFHSLDKVTSIAIHLLPALTTYTMRWGDSGVLGLCKPYQETDCESLSMWDSFVLPMGVYLLWQIMYIIQTEILDRRRLGSDKSIQTSLRWLARDSNNGMNKLSRTICLKIGVMEAGEPFDPDQLKTKLVFWTVQLVFTFLTLIPAPLLSARYEINTAYILFVFTVTVYNGANYYFEVFAKRYIQQFQGDQEASDVSHQSPGSSSDAAPEKQKET